jgi:hypothetical protein
MGQFRKFLNDAVLKKVHLQGSLFMWSNERSHPTLEKINQVFVSNAWDDMHRCHDLHSLPSMCSDRAPLLLHTDNVFVEKR